MNDNHVRIQKLMAERRRKKFLERVNQQQEALYQKWKKDILEGYDPNVGKEERERRKKELLDFVHRYVFVNNLKPVDQILPDTMKLKFDREQTRLQRFINVLLLVRNFINYLPRFKTFMILCSAFLFFSFEYWLHYYTSFSLKDVNLTYKDIIEKIPPFF